MPHETLRFDVYGRMRVEVAREQGAWVLYRLSERGRTRMYEFVIPAELPAAQVATYLDDMLHEHSRPGQVIRQI